MEPVPASPITLAVVHGATPTVIERLDKNFFRVRFDRLTPRERSTFAPWHTWEAARIEAATLPIAWGPRSIRLARPRQPDQEGNDLQSRPWRHGLYGPAF